MVKFGIALLAISAFAAISLFAGLVMSYRSAHQTGCLASTAQGEPCPLTATPLAAAAFHVDGLRVVSTAITTVWLSLFALIGALVGFVTMLWRQAVFPFSYVLVRRWQQLHPSRFALIERLRFWFAIHENSPGAY